MKNSFYSYLQLQNLSANTIRSYSSSVKDFFARYKFISKSNLTDYKAFLISHFKPSTVNLRLQAINRYLQFCHKEKLQMPFIKIQQKVFSENTISFDEYVLLKNHLFSDNRLKWYFVVWFMGATGVRVGELVKITIEQIDAGYIDIYSKGNKLRRIYIPQALKNQLLQWTKSQNRTQGLLFSNRFGNALSTRGVALQLKTYAAEYGINPQNVHPHAFRHLFARTFLDHCTDISLLSDLLGHENISTTRLYLRRTSPEQQQIVDRTVVW